MKKNKLKLIAFKTFELTSKNKTFVIGGITPDMLNNPDDEDPLGTGNGDTNNGTGGENTSSTSAATIKPVTPVVILTPIKIP